MSEKGPGRHARRARGRVSPVLWLGFAFVVLAAVAVYSYLSLVPSPAAVLARMRQAGEKTRELSCLLKAPWPEAYPATSGMPGARALLGPEDSARVWSVRWRASAGFRAEVLEPPGAAGTLTLVGNGRWWVYNPHLKLALTGPGEVPSLLFGEIVDMLASGTEQRVTAKSVVSGRRALAVTAGVTGGNQLLVDVDRATWLPLRVRLSDPSGRILASLEIEELNVNPTLDSTVFSFEPPPGTRVLAGAVPRSYPDLASAAGELSFSPKVPGYIPTGFALSAVNVSGEGQGRALVLTWMRGAGGDAGADALFSLTQCLAGEGYAPLPYGRPEERGALRAKVFELGEMRVVDWRLGDLALTLFGSISSSELLNVAASIK